MSHPTLPAYLGTWDELLQALLHNPFLGSGKGGPQPKLELDELRKSAPTGIHVHSPAVALLLSGIGAKLTALRLKDATLRSEMVSAAEQALADWEDDFCGTPPHPYPWVFVTAVELVTFANSLPQGPLQAEVIRVAGQLIQKSFGAETVKQVAAAAGR